jgi:hypothetical protein
MTRTDAIRNPLNGFAIEPTQQYNLWERNDIKFLDGDIAELPTLPASATPAQVALRKIYDDNFKPKWTQDIREAARLCERSRIIKKIQMMDGAGAPLMLRPPFNKRSQP